MAALPPSFSIEVAATTTARSNPHQSTILLSKIDMFCLIIGHHENGSARLQTHCPEIERRGTTRTRRARQYFPGSCAHDRGAHQGSARSGSADFGCDRMRKYPAGS